MSATRHRGQPPLATAYLERAREGDLPRVLVLAGAEAWLREEVLRVLLARAFPGGDPGGALVRLDARRPEEKERCAWALDEVRTPSLFGERKVVVVDGAEAAVPAGARPAPGTRKVDAIVALSREAAAGPATGSVLVLRTDRAVKGKGALDVDALREAGAVVVDCRPLYAAPGPWESAAPPWDHELSRWLSRRMRQVHGKTLDLPEAHALTERVGTDLGELDGALRTLALAVGEGGQVTARDVESTLGVTREDPVWTLVDAILEGQRTRALDLVAAAFDRGLTDARGAVSVRPDSLFHALIASLHASFRRTLLAAEGLARGEPPGDVARAAGVPPFLAEGFLRRAARDPEVLLGRHGAFLEAEAGVKGGGIPPRLAFERLVVRLTEDVPAAPYPRPPRWPGSGSSTRTS